MAHGSENKVVVVTGAAEGLGLAITEAFLQRGFRAVLLDLNEKLGIANTEKLNTKYNNRAVFWKCDVVTDLDEISKRIFNAYKNVDVLVNNAGYLQEKNPKKMMEINVTAVIEWTRRFWDHMNKNKGGKGGVILNMASVYGYRMDPWLSVYKATKFAVVAFTKAFGHKIYFNKSGVKVCAVCPGFTYTNFTHEIVASDDKEFQDLWIEFVKKQLWQEPSHVSKGTMEIYDEAETGTAWVIEGGLPIREVQQFVD